MRRISDHQGSTNWETWNVKLWMDNEAESQQHAQALVAGSKDENEAAAQLQDWAIREYIGPHNRDAIEDAHDWNSIPEEERIDHELESMKERNPEDEDMFNDLFGQGDVKDVDPTIIDPEMVNWLEIVQSIKNSLAENHEWEFNLQKGKELGIDFMMQHGSDPDLPKNRMYDAWMRHHNALSDDEIEAQGGKTWDHPQAESKLMMWNPIEAIKAGGSEYGWPHGFGDKHVQEIEQNGGWNERVSEVGRRAVHDAMFGRDNPYHPKLREAMQTRYSPEQIEQMMQPQFYYDEYADKYLPLEEKPKLVDPAFDQPGDLTIPEKWGHIANYLSEEEVRALPPDENPFAWRPGDIIQDRNGHRIYITDSMGASGSVPGIHLESGSNAGIGQDRWNVEVYGEPIGLHWRALQGTYGYKRVQRAQANPLDQPGDMTLPEDWHMAAGHGWDTMFAQDMANLKYDDPDDYYSIRRPFLVGFDSIEDPSPEVWIGSPGEYHHDVDRSHPVQQKAKRFFGEIWENTDPPVFRNADGAGFFDKYAIPYAERQYFQEQGMKKRAGSMRYWHITTSPYFELDPRKQGGVVHLTDDAGLVEWAPRLTWPRPRGYAAEIEVPEGRAVQTLTPDAREWQAMSRDCRVVRVVPIEDAMTKTASDGADYWTQGQDDWWGQENSNLFNVEVPGEAPGMPRNMETGFTKPCWCDVGPTDPHEWSGACENGKRPITHEEVTKLSKKTAMPYYHVTDPHHRESIEDWGLDHTQGDQTWRAELEAEGVDTREFPFGNYLYHMDPRPHGLAPSNQDVWEVDEEGLPLHPDPDPEFQGEASYSPEIIPPERLRLIQRGQNRWYSKDMPSGMVSTPDQIKMPTSPPDDGWGDAQYDTDTFLDHRMLNNSLKTQEQAEQYKEFLKRHQRSEQAEWPSIGMKEAADSPSYSDDPEAWMADREAWHAQPPRPCPRCDRGPTVYGSDLHGEKKEWCPSCGWTDQDEVEQQAVPKPGDYAKSRDGHPVQIMALHTEGENLFATIRYLDGYMPYPSPGGRAGGTEEDPLWEHRVYDGKVVRPGGDYYNDNHWVAERGLRLGPQNALPGLSVSKTAADNVPGAPVSDSGHWVWLDGKVGFGEHHHEIAKSLADELGYNKADSAYISNWLARGHCPEDKAVAVGTFKNNRPHIWNSTRDRNAIWDAVMEAREADPSQHIAEVMAPTQMPNPNYVLDYNPEDSRDTGWQSYAQWKIDNPQGIHHKRMNEEFQDMEWPNSEFPKGTYSPAGLTWKQAQAFILARCAGNGPCDQIANAVPDQPFYAHTENIEWVIEKVDPAHFSKVGEAGS